jgi:hypothetical protein
MGIRRPNGVAHAFGRLAMDRAACEFARARELSYATALETGATLRASGSETYEALDGHLPSRERAKPLSARDVQTAAIAAHAHGISRGR